MAELLDSAAPKEQPKENILGTASIGKLLVKFAVPGIVSMVVNAMYNVIDQIFIGQYVGYLGNGATSVVFPISTLYMAFILMLGDGTASFMSLRLGEKRQKEAAKGTASGIAALVVAAVILTIGCVAFITPLCRAFGSSDDILPYAVDYGRIICYGFPLVAMCAGGSSIIRADGKPLFNLLGLGLGTVINITLDAVLIIGCGWGVKGAAVATIAGQGANCLLNIWYLIVKLQSVELNFKTFEYWWKNVIPICKLGISSFITQAALVVAMATRNNTLTHYGALSKYGDSIPVTTLGITMKFFSILMCIILGLAGGAQPIFGYNYGAGKYDRVKHTYKVVIIIATIVACLTFFFAQVFPLQIISIFGSESDLYNEFAVKCMRIYLMLVPTAGFQMATGVFFQSTGYPGQASLMSLSKQVLFQVPATLILPIWLGVEGCLWAGPVSDILAFTLTLVLVLAYWKKIFSKPVFQGVTAEDAPKAENTAE